MSRSVLVVGGTSALGEALAGAYAGRGFTVVLAARDHEEAGAIAADLRIRHGVAAEVVGFEAEDAASHGATVERVIDRIGCPDVVLFAVGDVGDTESAVRDADAARRLTEVNYGGIVSLLSHLLPYAEKKGQGGGEVTLVFIGSVAGDRGRKANFLYGAAKAALHAYAQGLRAFYHGRGIRVVTVKLGFMDSRMAFGRAPAALTVSPTYAAGRVVRAVDRRRDVVYVPGFWRLVMAVLKVIPERVFKRLPLP